MKGSNMPRHQLINIFVTFEPHLGGIADSGKRRDSLKSSKTSGRRLAAGLSLGLNR